MGRGVSIQRVGRHVCQVAAWAGWRTAWGEGVCPSAEVGGPERRKAAAGVCGPGSLSGSSSCTLLNSSHTFRSQRPGFPPTQPLPGTRARLPPRRLPGSHVPCVLRSAAAPVPPRGPSRRSAWTGRPGVAVVCPSAFSVPLSARGGWGPLPRVPRGPCFLSRGRCPGACRPTCPQIARWCGPKRGKTKTGRRGR